MNIKHPLLISSPTTRCHHQAFPPTKSSLTSHTNDIHDIKSRVGNDTVQLTKKTSVTTKTGGPLPLSEHSKVLPTSDGVSKASKASIYGSTTYPTTPPKFITTDYSTYATNYHLSAHDTIPALDIHDLDPTTRPQDDFYQFATGGYLARHPIPADKARYGIDAQITERNEQTIKEILEELASHHQQPGTIEQKLADFYTSGLNTKLRDQQGVKPLRTELTAIKQISDLEQLQDVITDLHKEGVDAYFSFYATQDPGQASRVIAEAAQGGLGLPDRSYYFPSDNEGKHILSSYRRHIARTFELAGFSRTESEQAAKDVLELETALARASLSADEMRDPHKLYNLTDVQSLQHATPHFSWNRYFKKLGLQHIQELNLATPLFFPTLDTIISKTPLQVQKHYLIWRLISSYSPYLTTALEKENFNFYGKTLRGITEMRPLWKRVSSTIDELMGEALGQKFVEKRFSPEAKAAVLQMVENFKSILRDKIRTVSWMSDESRQEALHKLDTLVAKIGYPERPEQYTALQITPRYYLENVKNARMFTVQKELASIGKPLDRGKWLMTPATNNAYYEPTKNEIVFPAGILQPPYFSLDYDEAANYGAIGATIGHEMGHAFDDSGAQFDAQGNLRNWFTPTDLQRFKQMASGVEKQFNEYLVEGQPVNGKLVLGEALADLGGLELAYAAFERAIQGKPRNVISGFTPEQRFFLAFARSWATNVRPEYAKLMLKTDPHPIPKLRVNATVSNMEEFFEAFNVKPGEPMRRPEKARNSVWNRT